MSLEGWAGAHGFGCLKSKAPLEDRETIEKHLFLLVEQVVTPVDRSLQCLLTRKCGTAPSCEQTEAIVEPAGNLLRGKYPQARCGQFDGERHSIKAMAKRCHRPSVFGRDPEAG